MAVDSETGEGTVFKVCLPISDEEGSVTRPSEGEEGSFDPTRILLVEDDEMVREVAREMLEQMGCAVRSFASPGSALSWCRENPEDTFDLLLTDVVMPDMSGVELAREIRTIHPGLAVLPTSGYTDDAMLRHGVEGGEVDLLPKPFDRESLARSVREALEHGKDVGRE
ncbi:MAG: response regulator [bacterium]